MRVSVQPVGTYKCLGMVGPVRQPGSVSIVLNPVSVSKFFIMSYLYAFSI